VGKGGKGKGKGIMNGSGGQGPTRNAKGKRDGKNRGAKPKEEEGASGRAKLGTAIRVPGMGLMLGRRSS
jgi:hypothetical protein